MRSVLIIEDDGEQCANLCRLLGKNQIFAVCKHTFTEGLEATERARTEGRTFNIVICDLSLPDSIIAMETAKRLPELKSRVIAWTGVDDPNLVREFRRQGVPYILKGTSSTVMMKEILNELELQEPSPAIERQIMEQGRALKKRPSPDAPRRMTLAQAVAITVGVLTICGLIGSGSIFAFTRIYRVGADTSAAAIAAKISADAIVRESSDRQVADEKLAELIVGIQMEQKKLSQQHIDADKRDQESADDRKYIRETVASTNRRIDQNIQDFTKGLDKLNDKLDRIIERQQR